LNWFQQSWALIVSWAATLAAIIVAIRAIYAAERDRKALEQVDLEREKLTLEVKRLRNSPELVADRRAVYERLRKVLAEIIGPGAVTLDQVSALHEISHDTEFRYPRRSCKACEH
jgi:hypothetical protein